MNESENFESRVHVAVDRGYEEGQGDERISEEDIGRELCDNPTASLHTGEDTFFFVSGFHGTIWRVLLCVGWSLILMLKV